MPAPRSLLQRRVVICVSGSIAAYKSAVLVRALLAEGAVVDVAMTRSAQRFVGPDTFAGLTGRPCHADMFAPHNGGELHVDLARQAEVVVVAPASADLLSRFAQGRADDLVTALVLAASCPVVVAPAMHPTMWSQAAVQRNVARLQSDGRRLVGPAFGAVASGDSGYGRMAEPEEILTAVIELFAQRPLAGRRVVVTAGPTREAIDPVRYLSNRSSGRMGFAVAEHAAALGAAVTLIAGPVSLATPAGVERVDVVTALEMRAALHAALGPNLGAADALVMAAAVADFRPEAPREEKLKRGEGVPALRLIPNPDLLSEVGAARHGARPVLVGFALETGSETELADAARRKLDEKRVDLVVANLAESSLDRETNRALLVAPGKCEALGELDKRELGRRIALWVSDRILRSENEQRFTGSGDAQA